MRRRQLRTLRVFGHSGSNVVKFPSRCKLSPFVPSRGHGARLSRAVCSDHGEHSRERAHAGKQATTGQPRTTRRTTPGGHRAACACGDAGRGPATAGRSCFRLRRCRGQAGGACQKPEQVALRRRRGAVRITPEDRTRPRRTAVERAWLIECRTLEAVAYVRSQVAQLMRELDGAVLSDRWQRAH